MKIKTLALVINTVNRTIIKYGILKEQLNLYQLFFFIIFNKFYNLYTIDTLNNIWHIRLSS